MKACTKCGVEQPLAEFGRCKRGSEARRSWCKSCQREEKRRWKAENPERDKEHWKRWREKQPPGILPYQRRWYVAQSHEAELAKRREWKRANPERHRELNRISYRRNLAQSRARAIAQFHRRKAAMKETSVDAALITELRTQPCAYCGSEENIEVDHIIPLARGGSHEPDNLTPACRFCNRSKGAKLLSEWLEAVA